MKIWRAIDDVMGIFGTSGDPSISIYSIDKDLFTIPVRQWDFKANKFIVPTELESMRFLYTQVLTGDTVDGFKGCPRIGKVKAEAALRDCKNELEMLEQCYVRYHKVYDIKAKTELIKQIGQARILHSIDYTALVNFNKTYDPFDILNVCDDMLPDWCKDYAQQLIAIKEAKKAAKRKPKVKDAV